MLRTSKLRKKVPRPNLKHGKCNTHCQSQNMHMDTSLGQGVFHGWCPLPLKNPKKQKKVTKKILTAAQQIPGGQGFEEIPQSENTENMITQKMPQKTQADWLNSDWLWVSPIISRTHPSRDAMFFGQKNAGKNAKNCYKHDVLESLNKHFWHHVM